MQIQSVGRGHDMRLQNPDRVAVPKNRREVVRLVDLIHDDGQVGLTSNQGRTNAGEAGWIHGRKLVGWRKVGTVVAGTTGP